MAYGEVKEKLLEFCRLLDIRAISAYDKRMAFISSQMYYRASFNTKTEEYH